MFLLSFFLFKQKTAYEMRISDWSSDVCSSDLSDKPTSLRISPLQGREGEPGLPKTKRPRKSAGACVSNIFRPRLTRRSALGNRRDRLIDQCLVGLGVMLVGDPLRRRVGRGLRSRGADFAHRMGFGRGDAVLGP